MLRLNVQAPDVRSHVTIWGLRRIRGTFCRKP